MHKFLLFCLVFVISGFHVFGQCDWDEFNTHEVQAGETVFGISKTYGLSVDQLIMCNDSLAGDYVIKPGQVLRIPIVPVESAEDVLDVDHYIYHQVEAGQTLYSISKMYPELSVDQIMEWNNLPEPILSIGHYLIVGELETKALFGAGKKKKKKKEKESEEDGPLNDSSSLELSIDTVSIEVNDDSMYSDVLESVDTSEELITRIDPSIPLQSAYADYLAQGMQEKFSKGIANYLEGTEDEPLVVLCNELSLGTVVKIRNLINNQITYAKVIGKLPASEDENIMIKLSYSTARKLNVLDKKVLVEMSYAE